MNKIIPSITDTLMHSGNNLTCSLASLWRHFFYFVPLALCFGKCLFLFPKKARICYLLFIRKHSKIIKSHVNANGGASVYFFRGVAYITRDSSEPLARGCAPESARLRHTLKWSVLDNPNTAYFAQSQALIVQSASVGKLRIGDRIIAILTLVSWKACFLARLCFLFETAEKSFERPIYSLAYLLKNLRVKSYF